MFNALNSTNECVKMCAVAALNGSQSSSCNNINLISCMLGVSKYSLVNDSAQSVLTALNNTFMPDDAQMLNAQMVRDLLTLSAEGYPGFHKSDFLEMLNYICM